MVRCKPWQRPGRRRYRTTPLSRHDLRRQRTQHRPIRVHPLLFACIRVKSCWLPSVSGQPSHTVNRSEFFVQRYLLVVRQRPFSPCRASVLRPDGPLGSGGTCSVGMCSRRIAAPPAAGPISAPAATIGTPGTSSASMTARRRRGWRRPTGAPRMSSGCASTRRRASRRSSSTCCRRRSPRRTRRASATPCCSTG